MTSADAHRRSRDNLSSTSPDRRLVRVSRGESRSRYRWWLVFLVLVVVALLAAAAAVVPRVRGGGATVSLLDASVDGSTVTARAIVKTPTAEVFDQIGICVRDADGNAHDFPMNAPLEVLPVGTRLGNSAQLPAGDYSYLVCLRDALGWLEIGPEKTFTVTQELAIADEQATAMPVGDLPGWKQVLAEDFDVDVARGEFPGPYVDHWMSYDELQDTHGVGDYEKDIISAEDSVLRLYLHAENGRPLAAAPIPLVSGSWGGQTYGRFSVRLKSDPVYGYKIAALLWPDSEVWADGEINFPEGRLDGTVHAYNHCIGDPARNCMAHKTDVTFADWHVYTIEWKPGRISYFLDGERIAMTTKSVPDIPMHWVLQTETDGNPVQARSSAGFLSIDWATIYTWEGSE